MTEEDYNKANENRSRKRAIEGFLTTLKNNASNILGYGYHKDYLVELFNEKLSEEIEKLDSEFEKL